MDIIYSIKEKKEIITNSNNFVNDNNYKNMEQINKIKAQLIELNFDLLQDQAGLIIPNLNEKKQQFIELHNELRTLLGKETREVK